jgi:hypothetical protein
MQLLSIYPILACITRMSYEGLKIQEFIPEVTLPWAPLVDIYTAVRMCCFALFFLAEVLLCSFVYYCMSTITKLGRGMEKLIPQTIPMNHVYIKGKRKAPCMNRVYIYV